MTQHPRPDYTDAFAPLRILLGFGWRWGLGFRLGPRRSPLMVGQVALRLDPTVVRWSTAVFYRRRRVARALWTAAVPVHRLLIPRLLRRAAAAPAPA